jgi:hypothetical protein
MVMRAQTDAGYDIGGTCAARDECRPPVNHGIVSVRAAS